MSYHNSSAKHPFRKHPLPPSTPVRLGVAALAAGFMINPVLANPVNPVVVSGAASFNQVGKVLTVTNSNGAIIDWDKFSIRAGETTRFDQPSASSAVMNRVLNEPSAIYGTLSSNGRVWLINPAGIMVGPSGRIDTSGFVASTLSVRNEDFLAGRKLFVNDGTAKDVINQGEIRTPAGGSVYLIGSNVSQNGIITTPNGETLLAAGATVSLIDSATPGLKVDITGAKGNSTNLGTITAEAGRIGIAGVIVRNSGVLNASSVVSEGGRVFLRASKDAYVDAAGRIVTTGTRGGRIEVLGALDSGTARIAGMLDASATGQGDGGFVETSAGQVHVADTARVITTAPVGRSGTWLIDPVDFTIAATGGNISGAALASSLGGGNVSILSSNGTAGTAGDVNVDDVVAWSANRLTLNAYNNININANLNGSGSASLALEYGQGAVAAGNTSAFRIASGTQVNLPAGPSFSTTLGSDGVVRNYTVITSLGAQGSTTAADLQGMNGNLGGSYALGSDIDASATSGWNSGNGFLPVGDSTIKFTGALDGLNHTITGLTINRPATDHVGLLGFANGATIRNLGLVGGSITGAHFIGALVGWNQGTISNSYATGSVSGGDDSYSIGGLVGWNQGMISNSYATGSVSGGASSEIIGGLAGYNYSGTISSSYATGSVSGGNAGQDIGGLVGLNQGTINNSYATGSVSAGDGYSAAVGGLVGYNGIGTISNSYATGNVSAGYGGYYIGGLAGLNDRSSIGNSYATGSVSSGVGSSIVGGLVGMNEGSTISNSYATGSVSAGSGSQDIGGLVGFNSSTVTDSFWDTETSGRGSSDGGAGLTSAQAMLSASYPGWDFSTTWYMVDGATRPFLRMEHSTAITNAHQLQLMLIDQDAHYSLVNNISMAELSNPFGPWNTMSGFVPVTYFVGILDGKGHTITDLKINRPGTDFVGLFGEIGDSGIVRNLGLVNADVAGRNYVGGLVGELYGTGSIDNSYVTGAVSGSGQLIGGMAGLNFGGSIANSYSVGTISGSGVDVDPLANYGRRRVQIGGLVGENYGDGGNGIISNSSSSAVVSATGDMVGGLVGYIFGGIVRDSHSTGAVTAIVGGDSGNQAGGLVGQNDAGGSINNTYSSGRVSGGNDVGGLAGSNRFGSIGNSYSTSEVIGNWTVGGLVGENRELGVNIGGSIGNSYATGPVSGSANYVGGLAGFNGGGITNAYATGTVSGSAHVGGLAGYHGGGISNSYASGAVSASSSYAGGLVGFAAAGAISNSYSTGAVSSVSDHGGLVGKNTGTTTSNGFWDTETSGQLTSAGGTGLTTAQMKTAATFTDAGWSAAVWNIADGAYPTLQPGAPVPSCVGYDNCWTGTISNLWSAAGNWYAGHVPTASESIKIDVDGTPTISITGINPSFGSLWLAENLDVDAGVSFALSNLFTLVAGTATFDGTASVHSYDQTGGTLAGNGAFAVTESFSKSAGTIDRMGEMSITQASGALNFAATRVGGLTLNASTIDLGPTVGSGISLTADNLSISGAVSSSSMSIQPKTHTAITLGRSVANHLSLLQSDLDELTTGYIYLYANSLAIDSGSATPVTFPHLADYLYTAVDQLAIESPLTLSQPGTALYLGASRIDIDATATVGAGGVFLGKNASNVAYLVGVGSKTYPANTVELTNAELRRIDTTGPVIIGDPYNAHGVGHGPLQVVGPIDLTDTALQLRLVGNGVTQAAGATITVPQLAVDGYGSINLPEANDVGSFAAKSDTGGIVFNNAGALTIGKVATTASPYNFSTEGVIAGGGVARLTANGALTVSAGAAETVKVSGTDVWLTFNGDLALNAASGGQAYVEAASAPTIHLDFTNSTGRVKFNGTVASAVTNGVAGPGTADFIGFWNAGIAAVPGSTLLLSNTAFWFGGACSGYDNCWTGSVDSLWTTAGNWTAGHAPNGTEAAKVDVDGTPTISLSGASPSFGSLWLAENLDVDAGVSFTLGNLFTLTAGTATFNGSATVHGFLQTGGTLAGSGAFTVADNFSQTGGNIDRAGATSVTQASGHLLFSAINVGPLNLRANSGKVTARANGDISLAGVSASDNVLVAAGRDLAVSGSVHSDKSISLASGASYDGTAFSTSGNGGNIVLGTGSQLGAGDGVTYHGNNITVAALAGSAAPGNIAQSAGGTVDGDTVSFYGSGSVTLDGSVRAVNYSPAALNIHAGTNYLDPAARTAYGGDVSIDGTLDAQDVNIAANAGASHGGGAISQGATSTITVRGGQMTATASGDALFNGAVIADDAPVTILAGHDSIVDTDVAGKNVSLGRIEAAGASITATGAILDGNGSAINIVAEWTYGPAIQLRSMGGGSAGGLAISADTATVGSITANVDSGASHGGICIRNSGAATPGSINLADRAAAGNGIAFSHGGSDLVLNLGSHLFLMDNGGDLSITAGSNMTLDGGAFALPNNRLRLQAASIRLGTGSSIEAGSILATVANDITLDDGGHFHAGNDVDLSFAGPASTLSMNNGGYVLANAADTIRLDFKARSSGGVMIDDVETIKSLPGGSGLFVVSHSTPALPGAGLEITYGLASSAVLDLCAFSPTLCNPPNPGVSPLVTELDQAPERDEETAAKCAEGSFGCEAERVKDGQKTERRAHRGRVAQCM